MGKSSLNTFKKRHNEEMPGELSTTLQIARAAVENEENMNRVPEKQAKSQMVKKLYPPHIPQYFFENQ